MQKRYSAPMFLRENRPAAPRKTLLYVHGLGESGLCFEDLIRAPGLSEYHHLAPEAIPNAGHWPFLDQPKVFPGLLLESLKGMFP